MCKQRNIYYDDKIKVNAQKKAEVLKLLSDLEKLQGFEQVANNNININFGFEGEEQKKSSHQSRSLRAAGGYNHEGGMGEDQVEDADDINYWQCPKCEKPNLFDEENSKCKGLKLSYGYVDNCYFSLEKATD